jgi:DNA-binding PadR family transcriptional regulator
MKRGASSLLIRVEQRGFVDVEKVPSEKGPPRKVYCLHEGHRRKAALAPVQGAHAPASAERSRNS